MADTTTALSIPKRYRAKTRYIPEINCTHSFIGNSRTKRVLSVVFHHDDGTYSVLDMRGFTLIFSTRDIAKVASFLCEYLDGEV